MFSTSVSIFPSQNGSVFTCCRWQIFSWRQACYVLIHHLPWNYGVGGFNWTSSLRDLATNSSPSPFLKSTYQQHTPFKSFQKSTQKSRWFHPTLLNPSYRLSLSESPSIHQFWAPPRCRRGQNDRWNRASSAPRAKSEPWPGDTMLGNDGKLSNNSSPIWFGKHF